MPTSGLPPLVRFVPFFPFGRSFLPPLSVITSHALSASFVVAIFLFRPFLFAPLRFAFFKVEKRKRPLFFQRWLFLHSVRGSGTPSADFFIFPLLRSWRRSTLVAPLCPRSSSDAPAPRLHYGCRPTASPNFLLRRHWLSWDFTPFTSSTTIKSAISAPLLCHFFCVAVFLNFVKN
jgi:hypothetical protein